MEGNGKLAALVLALGTSLKGVAEVVRAFKAHKHGAPVEYLELVERLERREAELVQLQAQLDECTKEATSS